MNERIFKDDAGGWFFHIRGNQVVGPFETYDHAYNNLDRHVSSCRRRITGMQWPRSWLPGRLRRKAAARSEQLSPLGDQSVTRRA